MKTTIKKEWIYEQAPNEVWEYLTQAELIALWLMPNDFKLALGHEFHFKTNPMPSLDLDGIMHCKVMEIEPFKKLVYSWKAGSGDGLFSLDTVVEWKLEPHGKGTLLSLQHTGFKEANLALFNGMTDGWEKISLKLADQLNLKH
ncbi:SRPBCC family protein [Flavobacterium sp.]|uniref:SRPBCC family protein n=1 Tax=Flavobacterium sp. TaxID=239 RepID=UPI003D6BF46A